MCVRSYTENTVDLNGAVQQQNQFYTCVFHICGYGPVDTLNKISVWKINVFSVNICNIFTGGMKHYFI
jgi:hypothetical protein